MLPYIMEIPEGDAEKSENNTKYKTTNVKIIFD